MFKNLLILVLAGTVLYLTNPNENEFIEFYSEKIEAMKEDAGWADKVVLETKELNVKMNVKSENKVIYSLYTINFMGKEEEYIGIGTKFITAEKVREGTEKIKSGIVGIARGVEEKMKEI